MSLVIPLTQGFKTVVDGPDYERLIRWRWKVLKTESGHYAVRSTGERGRRTIYMHRFILDAHVDSQIDHRDGDGLNNQRSNLRIGTKALNMRNRGPQKNNTSGFKGVWMHHGGKWVAEIRVDGKKYLLGHYENPVDAARAYDAAATEHFGEFAWLNFPTSEGVQYQCGS